MGIEGIVYSVLSESGVLFSAKVFYNKSNAVTSTNRLKSISSSVGRIPKIYNVDLIKSVALTELVLGIPVNKLLDESVATEFLSIEELEILGSQVGELRNQDPRIQMQSIFEISTGDLVRVDAR